MDALQHLNNVVYFRFFEQARIILFDALDLSLQDEFGPILAYIDCQFKQAIHYPDEISVGSWIDKIGHSSFTVMHHVYSTQKKGLVAASKSVIVLIDYQTNEKVSIPQGLRDTLASFQMSDDMIN